MMSLKVLELCLALLTKPSSLDLQSEDKQFAPVKEIEGPLLTLKHVVQQDYFPQTSADIFIAFLVK